MVRKSAKAVIVTFFVKKKKSKTKQNKFIEHKKKIVGKEENLECFVLKIHKHVFLEG